MITLSNPYPQFALGVWCVLPKAAVSVVETFPAIVENQATEEVE